MIKGLAVAIGAISCIGKSKNLPKFLQLILVAGNFINGVSSAGFRVVFLEKVSDIKGRDQSVLAMIVDYCKDNSPQLLLLLEELSPLRTKIKQWNFESEIAYMKRNHKQLQVLINSSDETYRNEMKKFEAELASKMLGVYQMQQRFAQEIKNVYLFFGEQDCKISIDEMMGILYSFLNNVATLKNAKRLDIILECPKAQPEGKSGHLDSLLDKLKGSSSRVVLSRNRS